ETKYKEVCANQPTVLAHHHLAAGNMESAVEYFFQSGVQSTHRCATTDAHSSVMKALALLREIPPSRRRHELEINLRSLLGRIYMFEDSWADPRVEIEFKNALKLCAEIDEVEKSIPILWALASSHLLAGRVHQAVQRGRHLVSLTRSLKKPRLVSAT